MTARALYIAALVAFAVPLWAQQGLTALDDAALGDVYGQSGIAADLEFAVNADSNGNALSNLNCGGADADPTNLCRMAFQFHNRGSGGGEWVTWKNFFGVLKLNNLWIDADESPTSPSPYPDNLYVESDGEVEAANRFMDTAGTTCLLDGSSNTDTCHLAAQGKPMLALGFNEGNSAGLELFLHLGEVAVEYGSTGYLDDNITKPALGLLIGDTRGTGLAIPEAHPAEIKIGGTMGLYGF